MNGFIIKDGKAADPKLAWKTYAEELERETEALVEALASERQARDALEARLARLTPRLVAC
ncbi:MAG: hypothetical protein VR70_10730 [Rhodospirillaceae bacterium BRH_c57]|nr:MAG: hypothetical protein VR70_10730 [Rhodospirillaceae bacterium BRH_c57]